MENRVNKENYVLEQVTTLLSLARLEVMKIMGKENGPLGLEKFSCS